ncbi:hypothetical protein BY996DRAFT_6469505 [Phakopsora pachyrhizi]|nr:hypothetical protein BY996DRAFT_6469505 [Phakopsora pachyrhizi]
MSKLNFQCNKFEQCIYEFQQDKNFVIFWLHVDKGMENLNRFESETSSKVLPMQTMLPDIDLLTLTDDPINPTTKGVEEVLRMKGEMRESIPGSIHQERKGETGAPKLWPEAQLHGAPAVKLRNQRLAWVIGGWVGRTPQRSFLEDISDGKTEVVGEIGYGQGNVRLDRRQVKVVEGGEGLAMMGTSSGLFGKGGAESAPVVL